MVEEALLPGVSVQDHLHVLVTVHLRVADLLQAVSVQDQQLVRATELLQAAGLQVMLAQDHLPVQVMEHRQTEVLLVE